MDTERSGEECGARSSGWWTRELTTTMGGVAGIDEAVTCFDGATECFNFFGTLECLWFFSSLESDLRFFLTGEVDLPSGRQSLVEVEPGVKRAEGEAMIGVYPVSNEVDAIGVRREVEAVSVATVESVPGSVPTEQIPSDLF